MLMNNNRVKEEIKREIKNYLKTNQSLTHQTLWDVKTKNNIRGMFIAILCYLSKPEKRKISSKTKLTPK